MPHILNRAGILPHVIKSLLFQGCRHSPSSEITSRKLVMAESSRKLSTLETLAFDNSVLKKLPLDPEEENTLRQVKGACFSKVKPTPVKNPQMVAYSTSAMALLDLPEKEINRPEFVQYFSGSRILPGSETAAHCYCGFQFGTFAGQLGDGAVIYLGEIVNSRKERWEMQLKGAGKTPFSRDGDGRKVLRSSIREFLCSEAIHYLGIPTTRAGSCVTSDSTVIRDINYDGHPINERCTLVLRIAPSFIRFGSFQICKGTDRFSGRKGPSAGRPEVLQQLIDYVIEIHYPEIWRNHAFEKPQMYAEFYKSVVHKTAALVAEWQCVGFCHGVLNTDNMSILGLTIDYGPYGFMDRYDPGHICNTSDPSGRYAYDKQPEICRWNCLKLAEALEPLVPMSLLAPHLVEFNAEYDRHYMAKMRKKFGLLKAEDPGDKELIESFLTTMENTGSDFTNSFRSLSHFTLPRSFDFSQKKAEALEKLVQGCSTMEELKASFAPRMDSSDIAMMMALVEANPGLMEAMGKTFRQVLVEKERAEKLSKLQSMTSNDKKVQDTALWNEWIEKYMSRLNRLESELTSVTNIDTANATRKHVMNSNNPKFILRNYIAQNAISAAEKGDFSEVRHVLALLKDPFSDVEHPRQEDDAKPTASCAAAPLHSSYYEKPPMWAAGLRVT